MLMWNTSTAYGAAIALAQVSLTAELVQLRLLAVMGRQDFVFAGDCWRASITSARSVEGETSSPATYERARRGIAWVPQGRDVFPLLTGPGESGNWFCRPAACGTKIPD